MNDNSQRRKYVSRLRLFNNRPSPSSWTYTWPSSRRFTGTSVAVLCGGPTLIAPRLGASEHTAASLHGKPHYPLVLWGKREARPCTKRAPSLEWIAWRGEWYRKRAWGGVDVGEGEGVRWGSATVTPTPHVSRRACELVPVHANRVVSMDYRGPPVTSLAHTRLHDFPFLRFDS